MRTATPATDNAPRPEAPRARGLLLRKCACGGKTDGSGECDECKKKKLLQRRASSSSAPAAVPAVVHDVLRSPGRPLDASTRNFMEPRFGRDFSSVRIHDDTQAAQSARAVHAHAWTVGDHIAFAPGKYDPRSTPGRELLAHELAHTVQQTGLQKSSPHLPAGPEEQRLEREADVMAAAALRGPFPVPAASAPPVPGTVSRAISNPLPVPGLTQIEPLPGDDALNHAAYEVVEEFPLPKEKGPVKDTWDRIAKSGGLKTSLNLNAAPKVDIKQDRPELRATWLSKVGWADADKDKNWSGLAETVLKKKAPAGKLLEMFPRVNDVACHMDHAVELQVFGGNEKENIQVLDGGPNMSSGSTIRGYLSGWGEQIKTTLQPKAPPAVVLLWRGVKQDSVMCGPCCEIEKLALAGAAAAKDPNKTSEGAAGTRTPVSWQGKQSEIFIPDADKAKTYIALSESDHVENRSVSRIIPGLTLTRYNKKAPAIDATFDPDARLPIEIKPLAGKKEVIKVTVAAGGALDVVAGTVARPIHYSKLSDGMLTKVRQENGALAGEGWIEPSIPLLKPMGKLGFAFTPDSLKVTKALDPKKAQLPIPGVTVQNAELGLELYPDLKATGGLTFLVGNTQKPLLDGKLKFLTDAQGFAASGELNAHIPGVDQAQMTITYSNGVWNGKLEIESSQIKVPYVQSGRLVLELNEAGFKPSGEVSLLFPRNLGTATLGFSYKEQQFIYTGKGRFKVPGLNEVGVYVWYNGSTLKATAEDVGFSWKGLNGKMDVTYTASAGGEGTISGKGSLTFTKGDFSGEIAAVMDDQGRFSGKGTVKYPFKFRGTQIDATAIIILNKDQSVRVEGAIKLPQPVTLFRKFGDTRSIFHISKQIPIPGASIGPVGLQAVIEGGVDVNYGIGPGELRNVALTAAFNPLAANPDPNVAFHCDLHIPASAGFTGTIGGGLAVSAGIASVSGTVTVSAGLNLNATAGGPLDVKYSAARFELSAKPGIKAALNLGLSLDAHARAEAGIGPFSVSTEKTWNLGKRSINLAEFSMAVPIRYASNEEFHAPSLSDIEWGPAPQLDFSSILKQLFDGATPTESTA